MTKNRDTTYRYDCYKSIFQGIIESGWNSFALLIAIRHFDAPSTVKAILSGGSFIGFILSTVFLAWAVRIQISATKLLAVFSVITGISMLLSGSLNNLWVYFGFILIANILYSQSPPLMTHVYAHNYPKTERGKRVSTTFLIAAISGIAFAVIGGKVLDTNLTLYPMILVLMGIGAFAMAWNFSKIPSTPISPENLNNPWKSLGLVWKDKLFGWLLSAWMIMGIGNLMTLPIRIEYLAAPEYEINASNQTVALVTFVIPALARIVSTKLWGALFDRMNFIVWRISINSCFIIGFLFFFSSKSILIVSIGSIFLGFAMGGGNIAWNLWVTKLAPPDKVSAYMSVHTVTTGIRGVLSPFLGYYLISAMAPREVAYIAASMVAISIVMFALVWKTKRFHEPPAQNV